MCDKDTIGVFVFACHLVLTVQVLDQCHGEVEHLFVVGHVGHCHVTVFASSAISDAFNFDEVWVPDPYKLSVAFDFFHIE